MDLDEATVASTDCLRARTGGLEPFSDAGLVVSPTRTLLSCHGLDLIWVADQVGSRPMRDNQCLLESLQYLDDKSRALAQ